MLKKLGLILGLVFIGSTARAGDHFEPDLFYQVAVSSVVMYNISVGSVTSLTGYVPIQVDNPQLKYRKAVEIQNLDASVNLFCVVGSTYNIASTTNLGSLSTAVGRKIVPGATWVMSINDKVPDPINGPNTINFWCVNDGATGAAKAEVTQAY